MSEAQVFWDLCFSQGSALSLGGSRKGGIEADTPLHRRQHVSWEPTPSQKEKKRPCFAVLFSDLCWGCLETWNAIYHCICDSQGEWGDIVNELSFNSVSCFVKENTNSHLCPKRYPEEKAAQNTPEWPRRYKEGAVPLKILRDCLPCCWWRMNAYSPLRGWAGCLFMTVKIIPEKTMHVQPALPFYVGSTKLSCRLLDIV